MIGGNYFNAFDSYFCVKRIRINFKLETTILEDCLELNDSSHHNKQLKLTPLNYVFFRDKGTEMES